MKGLLLFTVVLLATVAIEGHGNGWCRGPRSHLNRRFDVGYALRFDGNDYVELPALSIGGALSFEFLVKVQQGVTGPIFSLGPQNNNIEISLNSNKRLSLAATRPGSGNSVPTTTAPSNQVPRDGWQYFVVTIDNNRQVTFYTAGDDDDSPTNLGGARLDFLPSWASRTPGYIGRSAKSPNNYFSGDLDDIRVWSRVLSQSEMDRNRDIPDGDSSLIAWWNFNQGLGNIATDVSFQGRDGTLGGNNFSATPQWIISQFTATRSCKIYRDVSMKTFDRKCFRIPTNRVGDFWLVQGDSIDVLAIQVRIQAKPGSNQGTVVRQLAFQYSGSVFRWDLDFASKSDSYFFVNNTQIYLNTYEDPFTGVSVYKTFSGNSKHQYDVDVPLGFRMKIEAFPRDLWTDITVRIPNSNANDVAGLCGDFNGQESGDDTPPVTNGWPVLSGQSLFQGPVNLSYPEPYNCDFIPGSQLQVSANIICGNTSIIAPYLRDECLKDICITGDIGAAYSLAEATYQDCLDDGTNTTSFCRPPCPNFCSLRGTCQLNGACVCQSGYAGADCSQQPRFPCFQAQWGDKQRQINAFKGVSSAIDHYAYSRTFPFSSASGKELSDTTNLYLYQEMSTNFLSLIHLNDKARDNTGGRVKATYSYTSTPSSNPSIKVYDDPSTVDDTYTSVTNGNFTANWQWWGCCTDGLVLELIRTSQTNNFCVAVNLTRFEGISQVVVSSENDYGSSDIYKLDNDRVRLCGTTCNNTCGTYSNCQSCTSDPKCGWCVETETCELGGAGGPDRGRCNLWRFSNKNNVARVIKTTVNYPVDPSAATIYLPAGQTATADFFVFVPSPENLPLDIVFSLDVTKYFGNDLAYIQSSTAAVFTSMSTYFPQSRLGITTFSDTPVQPLGSPSQGDFAYQENLRLTSNIAIIQNSLNAIIPRDGGDAQNSQLTALLQAARSTNLNWRSSAMKLIVVITKSDFHRPPTVGLPSGASEYPTPAAVRDALLAANIIPIFVVPTTLQSNYQSLVSSWGFGYVRGISSISAANIFSGVQETVNLLSTSIKAISLPATAPNVNAIYPAQGYTGVSAGTRVVFTATLSQTISGGATIVVPGFGSVDFTFVSSDLPQGSSQTVTSLNGGGNTIVQLYAYGYYGQAYPEITTLPLNQNVARIYQVTNGGNRGNQITSVPAALEDQTNKVWIEFGISGITSFSYQVKDNCLACSTSNYSVGINHQTSNQAPTAITPGTISILEDGNATILVTGTDPEDGTNVVTVITSFPQPGSLFQLDGSPINQSNPVVNGNRVLFRPVANQFGNPPANLYSSFTFSVRDTQGLLSTPALVSINVIPVNDAPVAFGNSTTTLEDTPVFITLSASDIDGDSLTYSLTTPPPSASGYLALQATGQALSAGAALPGGSVWFVPAANVFGQTSFQFRVSDGQLISNIATLSITVSSVNDAPSATPRTYAGTEDQNLTITLDGTDVENDPLTAFICLWNGVGTLMQLSGAVITAGSSNVQVTNRQVIYRPPPNAYSNSVPLTSFTFRVSDGSLQSSCVVASITIAGVPDAPAAMGPPAVYTNESRPVSFTVSGQNFDLGSVDFKVCSGPASGTLRNSSGAVLTTGSIFSGLLTPPDLTFASLTFTPPSGANGQPYDSFSFQALTSTLNSSCVTVNFFVLPVNDPPIASNDSVTTNEDVPRSITLLATDQDSPTLTFTITRLPSRGTLKQATDLSNIAVNSVVANGTVVFVPALNEFGVNYDSFDFIVSDGQLFSSPATVIVSVFAVNDKPTAYPFTLSFSDVSFQDITQFNGIDVEDGTNLAVRIESTATNGTLYICQAVNDVDCNTTAATSGATAPLKKVRFVPNPNVYGTYIVTFTYSVVDSSQEASDPVTVTLNVTKNNNPPTIVPAATPVDTFLGESQILRVIASDPDDGQSVDVLVYPSGITGSLRQCDPDGNGGCVAGASITIDPTVVSDTQGRVLYYAPQPNGGTRTGDTVLIRFGARDSLNSLSVTSILVNLFSRVIPLVPVTTSISFNEKVTSYPFTLTVNSTGNIAFNVTVLPTRGNLTQSDGTPISTVPTAVPGGNLIFVKPNSFDNGANYDSFTWTAINNDNGASFNSPAVTTVSVSPVNDAPQAIMDTPVFDEDIAGFIQLGAYDPDVYTDADVLTFTILIAPNRGGRFFQVSSGNVTDLSGPIVNGQTVTNPYGLVWFVPPVNGHPTDMIFRYRVTDSAAINSSPLDVLITINSINDPPVAFNSRFSGTNNQPVTIVTLNNFTDVEVNAQEQTASIQIVTLPSASQGTLFFDDAIAGNEVVPFVSYTTRIFKFRSAQQFAFGTNFASFTWRVSDGLVFSANVSATIDIVYFNTAPTVVLPGSTLTLDEDTYIDFPVAATDPDLGDSVELNFVVLPQQGTMAYFDNDAAEFVGISSATLLRNNTVVRYWPNADVMGTDTFTLQARDVRNSNRLDFSIVKPVTTLTIRPTNDPPVFINNQNSLISNGYGIAALSNGVTITDDASQNNGIITVTISATNAENVRLTNAAGLSGYNGSVTATTRNLTGTVANFNAAFAAGVEFYPANGASDGTLTYFVNDNGNNDYRANQPGLNKTLTIPISVDSQGTIGFSAGFIGVTTLMSAGVFGAYKIMKKKKLIPEEADPWENDELFDMTLDNPLYSGSNPSSLEPVFDSK